MRLDDIAHCEIHPSIGIARVGDSPDAFFIGPETPGVPPRPDGGFKDAAGRIKRQAARFRVYAYDRGGAVLGELTAAEARITWTAELANAKGAWFNFAGRFAQSTSDADRRNPHIDPADTAARARLVIRPGPRTVTGPFQDGRNAQFDSGTFLGASVPLGELRTDGAGRLLVLGGFGRSFSTERANPVRNYANNDRWCDDISDGPVRATVVLEPGGRQVPVTSAWCLVAPTDFAPEVASPITLYDVALEAARASGALPAPAEVSFTRDVHPLLARPVALAWVNRRARTGHGDRVDNFFAPDRFADLASDSDADAVVSVRRRVFRRLRTPGAMNPGQANHAFMPVLAADGGLVEGDPRTWLTLLPGQYERMRRWAAGDFAADWTGEVPAPVPLEALPPGEQPHALVRAALEAAGGGGFFPGIEMTFIADDPATWSGPFRLREDLIAGDVTKYMAVPWQADFHLCHTFWWPAARPDEVLPETELDAFLQGAAGAFREWDRGIGDGKDDELGMNEMAVRWSTLGFVVGRPGPDGGVAMVETERSAPEPE
ncbi:LodA/GoxA family CTQ-dependent oxidase [Streptomyces sp. NPDC127106]|uniref:LodA/GoxA family CTQ-dependent oxidase n=1 Tax=Streptomyces sp. NPDC127106 TaxID=3345360 RepID=UPI00363E53E9